MRSIHRSVYRAPGSHVIGDVSLARGCSVWSGAVLRGDLCQVTLGEDTNVQDNAVLHGSCGHDVVLGRGVVVGHGAIVHGCTVGDNTLIGMGAIVLDGARIGRDCIVGAGALVTQRTVIPDGSMAFGSPARVIRDTTWQEREATRENARTHVELAQLATEGDPRLTEE